jgi:uncharacterized phage infection (PIP) family protein YhgE
MTFDCNQDDQPNQPIQSTIQRLQLQQDAFNEQQQQQIFPQQQQIFPQQQQILSQHYIPQPFMQPPPEECYQPTQQKVPIPRESKPDPRRDSVMPTAVVTRLSASVGSMTIQPTGPMTKPVKLPSRPRPGRKPMPQENAGDRRRFQNRMAQRNFRDKRQQKLVDTLEMLARLREEYKAEVSELTRQVQEQMDITSNMGRTTAAALDRDEGSDRRIADAERRAEDAERRVEEVQRQLAISEHQAGELRHLIESQVGDLHQQLAEARQQTADTKQQLADVRQQLADVQQQLADSRRVVELEGMWD